MSEVSITEQYLIEHPNEIFVFGDNLLRTGYGGAAALRDLPNTYGFVTKKKPDNNDDSFYRPDEYWEVFEKEFRLLEDKLVSDLAKTFLISKLGSGLANRYKIWEDVIRDRIKELEIYPNVRFLYNAEGE